MVTRRLVVFTKPARPGRVKTRLIGALTAEQAAELHAAFLSDVVSRFGELPGVELQIAWALDDGEPIPDHTTAGFAQQGDDLGQRLYHGLQLAARGPALVAGIGSDHPDLPRARIEEAFRALEGGSQVVIGPAEDGGYYLFAAHRDALHPDLFHDVPWSTSGVLEATLAACERRGVQPHLLSPEADVDTPSDLEALVRRLEVDSSGCPSTRRLLSAWGLAGELV